MPWYKFYASHGPGHQSNTTEYIWLEKEPTRKYKQTLFEEIFGDFDWPIGKIRRVYALPKSVWENFIERAENAIRYNKRMLGILSHDTHIEPDKPVKNVYNVFITYERKGKEIFNSTYNWSCRAFTKHGAICIAKRHFKKDVIYKSVKKIVKTVVRSNGKEI